MRATKEWIGRTPDTPVPPRVRRRVFDRFDGRCYLSGVQILPGDIWEIEHVKSLRNGGMNVESNLAPALVEPHRAKTKRERKIGAKADRTRNKHIIGRKAKSRPMPGSRNTPFKKLMNGRTERRVT